MPDQGTQSPLRIVKIQVFQVGEETKETLFDKVAQIIKQKYKNVAEIDDIFQVSKEEVVCQFNVEKLHNFFTLSSTIKYEHYTLDNIIYNDLKFFNLYDEISSVISSSLLSTYDIFIPLTEDVNAATASIEQYSDHISKPKKGIGIVRGCLLSIFESRTGAEELFDRYYFLSPIFSARETAEKRLEEILVDIKDLAVKTAELSKLYSGCKNFFSVLESGEKEIGEKIEGFLWKLIGPEPVDLETLESWLGYIMERDSTTSAMIATMRVNHTDAKSIVSEVENILKKLNEGSFEDYPRNTEIEVAAYGRIVKPFENYIVRSEALKARLGTAMEEVRTYLSLQQQRITLDEQKASKEQLVRLVNLQEILHKVEILIVAFYLTEMARIVFESLLPEPIGVLSTNLLTAVFIPIALLISVLLSRMLHKGH